MTAEEAVLALGALILVSSGVGLVFVHSSNPLLKGLHRMGAALATAGTAAALTWASPGLPLLLPLADVCMVSALVLCNIADQLLVGDAAQVTAVSKCVLGIQVMLGTLQCSGLIGEREAIIGTSLMMVVQLLATSYLVQGTWASERREPALFTAALMRLLAFASVVRAALAWYGLLTSGSWGPGLNACTYSIYVAGAVGLGFAFFWRTTSRLSTELEKIANTDPLTRVYNRRTFLQWCEKVRIASQRSGESFGVLLLDFDHFKSINDRFGHHVGDEVLCAAVERIQNATRGSDVVCRWGGEEFAVLLPNADKEGATIAAERIRKAVQGIRSSSPRFSLAQDAFRITVSVGGAICQDGSDLPDGMLRRADLCLYEAKEAGRNCVRIDTAEQPHDTSPHSATLVSEAENPVSAVAS